LEVIIMWFRNEGRWRLAVCLCFALASPLFASDGADTPVNPAPPGSPVSAVDDQASSGPITDAETSSSETKSWRFTIAPYLWLTGTDITVVSGNDETNINVPFKDILEELNGGIMLYAEARWRRWYGAFDGVWASLGDTIDGRLLQTDVTVTERIFDLQVGYGVLNKQYEERAGRRGKVWHRSVLVDVYVGGRYFDTAVELVETPQIGNGDPRKHILEDQRWDPIVGVRVDYRFSNRWSFKFRGDIGGFGIGNAAQFAWNVFPLFEYRLSHLATLDFGYRALDVDIVEGQGADRSGYEMLLSGPVIGVAFRF
jgi:hypothetical protein